MEERQELRAFRRGALSVWTVTACSSTIQRVVRRLSSSVMRTRLSSPPFSTRTQATEDWLFALELSTRDTESAWTTCISPTSSTRTASAPIQSKTVHENLAVYRSSKILRDRAAADGAQPAQQLVVRKRLADMYFWFSCRGGYLRIGDHRTAHRYLSKYLG
jgi:hypothetical protein